MPGALNEECRQNDNILASEVPSRTHPYWLTKSGNATENATAILLLEIASAP